MTLNVNNNSSSFGGKQTQTDVTASAKSLSIYPITNTQQITTGYDAVDKQKQSLSTFNSSIGQPIELSGTASQPVVSVIRFLWSKSDWLIGFAFSLTILWILFMFATSLARRKYNPQRKLQTLTRSSNNSSHHDMGWRFSTAERQNSYSVNNSSNGTLINYGVPLSGSQQSTKLTNNNSTMLANNYYGNFNNNNGQGMPLIAPTINNNNNTNNDCLGPFNGSADFEHDMVQSCSQSLLARTMQNHHQQQLRNGNSHQMSGGAATVGGHYSMGGLTMASSNVPLINGTHNSRINLDYQQSRFMRPNYKQQQQQSFGIVGSNSSSQIKGTNIHYNEPIYDDVIYNNQMIL